MVRRAVSHDDGAVSIATINPATGQTIKTFTPATSAEIDSAIAAAHARFADYRRTSYAQRASWMHATADLLEAEAAQAAAMITLEMGKTLKSAQAEVVKCAKGFRFYADNAEALLALSSHNQPGRVSYHLFHVRHACAFLGSEL